MMCEKLLSVAVWRVLALAGALILGGCETGNQELAYAESKQLQVVSMEPGGRGQFFIKDPRTITALTRYFDEEVEWVKASELEGDVGASLHFRIYYVQVAEGRAELNLSVFGNWTKKGAFAARTDFDRVMAILEPHLFMPRDEVSYEVEVAGEFWDPLVKKDLGMIENRVREMPRGGAQVLMYRSGGRMHELKRPILVGADRSELLEMEERFGSEAHANVRYLVNEKGRVEEVEFLEASHPEVEAACQRYLDTMRFEAGVFDGRYKRYRVTQRIELAMASEAFDKVLRRQAL